MPIVGSARRAVPPAAALAALLVLAACGSGGDPVLSSSDTTTTTATPGAPPTAPASSAPTPAAEEPTFEVRDRAVVGGRRTIESRVGASLRIVVRSDVADEVHLHGYDLHAEVAPGADATLVLTTDIPGQFEIELEDAKLRLGELEVR
jgi:ABC-type glycerol-3-phosphate transport system substrate-binding protein